MSAVRAEIAKMARGWSSAQFSMPMYRWSSQWKKPDSFDL